MEKLITDIINYVRDSYYLSKQGGVPSPPQVLLAALLTHLRQTEPHLDQYSMMEAIDEMDQRGWVVSRGNGSVIFDEVML